MYQKFEVKFSAYTPGYPVGKVSYGHIEIKEKFNKCDDYSKHSVLKVKTLEFLKPRKDNYLLH